MFYCHNISGCHVGCLHGRNASVISAPGWWWLSHVTHEPNGLMLWSKAAFPPRSWVSFLMLTQGWDPNCLYLLPPSSAATKTKSRDFPGGPVVKTPAANARGMGSIPCQGTKISYARVQFSCPVISDSLWPQGLQHARPPCPSITPRGYSNSCPSSQWCHPTISSSVVHFSSFLQSFPASGSFPMSCFFASYSQNIGVSASA